jgi:hypothetical protein
MRTSLNAIAPTLLSRLQSRRDANQQRQALSRELAAYDTPSARLELDEIIARHTAEEARLVTDLLRQHDTDRLVRQGR